MSFFQKKYSILKTIKITQEITTKTTSSNTDFLSLSFKLTLELEILLITQKIAKNNQPK